jgi:phosphatidylserine decarboxylase
MKDALIIRVLSVLPRKGLSRMTGALARLRMPRWFTRWILRWYVRHYGVDTTEMVGGLEEFSSLAEFFCRPLRPGVRPVDPDPTRLLSPADGRLEECGAYREGLLALEGAGPIRVADLLGEGAPEEGSYAVIYLAPPDYHRVHAPCDCRVSAHAYRPGHLWPVFPAAVRRVPSIFSRNERLITWLEHPEIGEMALIMVGAYGVGRIRTCYADLVTNTGGQETARAEISSVTLKAGEELGRFELGSTVILLLPAGRVSWTCPLGSRLQYGQVIARIG